MTEIQAFQISPEDPKLPPKSFREEKENLSKRSSKTDAIIIIDQELDTIESPFIQNRGDYLEGTFGKEEIRVEPPKATLSGRISKKSERAKIIETISSRYKASYKSIEENIVEENSRSLASNDTEIILEENTKQPKPKAIMPSLKLKNSSSRTASSTSQEKSKSTQTVEKKKNSKPVSKNKVAPPNPNVPKDQEYQTLKDFYKVVIEERKQTQSSESKTKRKEIEDIILKDVKENIVPSKSPDKDKSIEKSEGSREKSEGSRGGQIKKQISSVDTKKYIDSLISKFKSISSIFTMSVSDLNILEKFRGKRVWEKDMANSAKKIFSYPELIISDYVQFNFDLGDNKILLEKIIKYNRKPLLQLVSFAQNFEFIHLIKDIAENKNRLIEVAKAQKSILKANFELEEYMKNYDGTVNSKKSKDFQTKSNKRVTLNENEVKLAMLRDIQMRLTQKNVFLALKFIYLSKKLGYSLICTMNQMYSKLLLFHTTVSWKYYSQLKIDKKLTEHLARERVSQFYLNRYFQNLNKYVLIRKQKKRVTHQIIDWNSERTLRRGFYSLLKRVQLRKLISNGDAIANKFDPFRLKLRSFLLLKHTKNFQVGAKVRVKSLYSKEENYDYYMTDKVSQNYRIDFANSVNFLKSKLILLLNTREYIAGPLRKINTILKLGIQAYSKPQHRRINSDGMQYKEGDPFYVETSAINRDGFLSNMGSGMLFNELSSNIGLTSYKGVANRKMNNTLNISGVINNYDSVKENIKVLMMTRAALEKSLNLENDLPHNKYLNIHDRRRFSEGRAAKEMLTYAFTCWKIAFINRCLRKDVEYYRTMLNVKQLLAKYRLILSERQKVEEEFDFEYHEKLAKKSLLGLKQNKILNDQNREKMIENFYYKKYFGGMKSFYHMKKEKKRLYKIVNIRYKKLLFSKILQSWEERANKNYDERHKIRNVLGKKMLKVWALKYKKRLILKNVFSNFISVATWYVEDYPVILKHKLKFIVAAWRNEVIENEHTAKQKIDNMLALRRFKGWAKKKYFAEFKKKTAYSKSLNMMTLIFKYFFKARIWNKWHRQVQTIGFLARKFRHRGSRKILSWGFKSLKKNMEKEQMIRLFKAKKFFLSWKAKNELKQKYLPLRMNDKRLMRKALTILIAARKHKNQKNKLDYFAEEHHNRKLSRLQKSCSIHCLNNN